MSLEAYIEHLKNKEVAPNTLSKYTRDVKAFMDFLDGRAPDQERLIEYKACIKERYAINTVNSKVTVLNNYMAFIGLVDVKVKQEQVQRSTTLDNVLSEKDYVRLIRMAETKGKLKMKMTMEILRYTGIRISELQFVTLEAAKVGHMDVANKGKTRRVSINTHIAKEIKEYCKANGITSGPVIVNSKGDPISRGYVFKELKWIGGQARVKKAKVYPHSFRHLFAKWWLSKNGENIMALADILGHADLDTTRIYTTLSTAEQKATMEI